MNLGSSLRRINTMNKTKKTELAREYATLKHAAWRDENVPECNNSKKTIE